MSQDDIVESMARTIWVSAYASYADENPRKRGVVHARGGQNWHDVTPETPAAADRAAAELAELFETKNNASLEQLAQRARVADGKKIDEEDFGYCLAMMAMGEGVGWWDDHERFDLKVPRFEVMYDGRSLEWSGEAINAPRPNARSLLTGPRWDTARQKLAGAAAGTRNPPSKRRLAQSMAYRRPETERPVPGERHTVVGVDQDGSPYTYNTDTGMGHAIHDEHPWVVAAPFPFPHTPAARGQAGHGHAQRGDAETQSDRETRSRRESEEYEQRKREAEAARQRARKEREAAERESAEYEKRRRERAWREAAEARTRAEARARTHASTPFDPFDPATARRDPRRVLGFTPSERLTTDVLKRRHRELARKHHPDMGGSVTAMQAINIAVDALTASGQVYGSNPGPAHTWPWK